MAAAEVVVVVAGGGKSLSRMERMAAMRRIGEEKWWITAMEMAKSKV